MNIRYVALLLSLTAIIVGLSCSSTSTPVVELKRFPVDNADGVIARSLVTFDQNISSDGRGSLQVVAKEPVTVRLFEVRGVDIENARLIYKARVKSENIKGEVYLEMLCHFPGMGEFFSRSLETPLTGTVDWTTEETPFFLQKGQKPDYVKLNLVINGTGTAWIDDIRLLKGPLG